MESPHVSRRLEPSTWLATASFWLLVLAIILAPWVSGARWRDVDGWGRGLVLPAASGCCAMLHWLHARRLPRVPRLALFLCLPLAVLPLYWLLQPELPFATEFAESHWTFMAGWQPGGMLQPSRVVQLAGRIVLLVSGLTAADLAVEPRFRRGLLAAVGAAGLGPALFSLGQKWLGWGSPAWLLIPPGELDQFSGPYFHYSAAAAAFNLAWPLLVATAVVYASLRAGVWVFALLAPLLVLVVPLWPAQMAWLIAIALLAGLSGILAITYFNSNYRNATRALCVLAAMALCVVQGAVLLKFSRDYPDGWKNAAESAETAPARDAEIAQKAMTRGDRLVSSSAPPRPVAWKAALRMAGDHPFVGDGPGAWVKRAVLYSHEPIMVTFSHHRQFAHHDFLQFAAEWGCGPALLLAGLWCGAFWRGMSPRRWDPANITISLALFGVALHSFWNFPLQVPALQLTTTVLLGLLWRMRREVSGTH